MTESMRHSSKSEAPDAEAVRDGEDLNWTSLDAYLKDRLPELEGALEVLQFPKGNANLTYLLRYGAQRLVLRRPPFGRLAPGAHNMAREYKTLSKLWKEYPPAPRALLLSEDSGIIGAPFFVMEYREGVGIWDVIPTSMQHHRDVGRRVGFAVVDVLSELHSVDPDNCNLADLGRPDGFVARQVEGWRKRWMLVAPDDGSLVMDQVAEMLTETLPAPQKAVILHNDLKVDNCQFDPDIPDRVKSVFDWDMATVGDPLIDVGILLNYFPDPSDTDDDRGMFIEGMQYMGLPTHDELIDRYSSISGLDVSQIHWYLAFAAWKTAVIRQQLYDRYVRGESSDPRMGLLVARIGELGHRAHRLLVQG